MRVNQLPNINGLQGKTSPKLISLMAHVLPACFDQKHTPKPTKQQKPSQLRRQWFCEVSQVVHITSDLSTTEDSL